MWSLSDETLLAGFGSEDPETSAAFVRRFQGRIYGLALSILGDPQGAEDAAQETFVRAWRHADAYDPRRGAVTTWLLTIGRNVAIDMARVRRPAPIDPAAMLMDELAGRQEERGSEVDEALRIRRALAGLPEDQRRPLVLAAFYGRTAREIAEIDGVPLGTVKTRIRAAMSKLRGVLEVRDG
jgi:RNA polymerase sigma factor (sigma-70 family)